MRVALIGGSGQLGTEIRRRWTDDEIVAPPHAEIDIEDAAAVAAMLDAVKPDAVVNCAAFHNVDRCEAEPGRAFAVNAVAVDRVAHLCDERSTAFVTISTDYVFDGNATAPYREAAVPHPLSLYGLSKLAGEHLALRGGGRVFVVRTCGLYGNSVEGRRPFIERVLAADSQMLRVVADVVVSPTFAGHLAAALRRLVATDAYGLYHAVNAGAVSWYDFACEARKQAGRSDSVEPIAADEWKAAAVRPRFSALENDKLDALGIGMPSWRDGIGAYLALKVR
ncbi:MAG: dTDP-4-dehydrorhamnose reductase [Candidatus Eremiobacteraeota bacterium]|nr:dTDP-4-dehydrorhamnose reductase [Candidatus Eremiobacteraeota bacterium]